MLPAERGLDFSKMLSVAGRSCTYVNLKQISETIIDCSVKGFPIPIRSRNH
ncbi:MAG: hypothetical protein CLLPBCKN_004970 [Chroococcidiopsis cubana SAG 39.79]|jgi:hypothetical protein|nr:hypothetical protein [Chroococcidiopsis cubana SAG 39.79]